MDPIGAVVGYAVGTLQILFIDWWKKVVAHRGHLRLLRAELMRLSTFQGKFDWKDGLPPEDEQLPIAPKPTELFIKTIGETDFRLTDEHRDDNSQQSLLHILDGARLLNLYFERLLEVADKAPVASPEEKTRLLERGVAFAEAYDARIDELLFIIDNAIEDIDRRLEVSSFTTQFDRVVGGIPTGRNPAPLERNDPRIEEWRRKRDLSQGPPGAS